MKDSSFSIANNIAVLHYAIDISVELLDGKQTIQNPGSPAGVEVSISRKNWDASSFISSKFSDDKIPPCTPILVLILSMK